MNDYKVESSIEQKGEQATLNDNELFAEFILGQGDWLERCPDIWSYLMEAYNNDWCDYVRERAAVIEDLRTHDEEWDEGEAFQVDYRIGTIGMCSYCGHYDKNCTCDLADPVDSDNADGIEDERNVYLAYFDAMGIDPAEATRIGRDEMRIKAYDADSAPCTVCGKSVTEGGVTWVDGAGRCVHCAPVDPEWEPMDNEPIFTCEHCGREYFDGPNECTANDCPGRLKEGTRVMLNCDVTAEMLAIQAEGISAKTVLVRRGTEGVIVNIVDKEYPLAEYPLAMLTHEVECHTSPGNDDWWWMNPEWLTLDE